MIKQSLSELYGWIGRGVVAMWHRLIRFVVILPLLLVVFLLSNSAGVTYLVTSANGWPDIDQRRLPAVLEKAVGLDPPPLPKDR